MSLHAALHPALLPSLACLPSDRPVALLTRHSTREMTSNGIASYELPLTAEGVALAEWWGGQLGRGIASLHSSPVGRCLDTARAIARGAGLGLPVQEVATLVEPGCFVQDMREVGPLFQALGPVSFANRHFHQGLAGLLSPAAGTAKILQHLHAQQGEPGWLSVHVTHDTILAAFIYHLLGQTQISEADWPWMMEGAWVWFEPGQVCWLWRGQLGRRDLAPYLPPPS